MQPRKGPSPPGGALTPDSAPLKHLHGKYKAFFSEQFHGAVELWYNRRASQVQRHDLRELVRHILNFDIEEKKRALRTTCDLDIIGANAVFRQNNGHMLSVEAAKKAVEWLSAATVAERNKYRNVFGLLRPPSMFSSKRQYDADFVPENKYMKSEASYDKGVHKQLIGEEHLHKPSEPFEHECEVIARHPSHTGTFFVWKTGATRKANILQKAHDATFKGAPWGIYGDGRSSNLTQWTSVTNEEFRDTFFLQNKDERRFQNYNDNYTHMLYRQYKDEKRRRRAERRAEACGQPLPLPVSAVDVELKVPPPNLACLSSSKYIMSSPLPQMRPKY